ncbi:hypothetical protein QJS04_geneDACA018012 [Acorus gramineus]|uniref:Ankyrin repeat domain-containing protein n=1 Tax=Acorus gramineus TaxID=55184 RepID=A0AAV9AAV8_ACOGR|nr:hypothetical protein QJS04_geneDACA018012 [Acorus gramineus]
MDVLADEVKAVKRVREVLATKFPPGTFPVKISIPVVPTVRVVITFSKFVDLQSSEQFFTPPSSPRDLPSSLEEEEEHHHHCPGSAASVHPMTLEEEDDPFTIPSDYTWTTLVAEDERLRRSSSRKGECKKKQSRKTCPR